MGASLVSPLVRAKIRAPGSSTRALLMTPLNRLLAPPLACLSPVERHKQLCSFQFTLNGAMMGSR